MNSIELLSPAKDLETGIAAINCGADAVYIGAPRFGARESAGNDLSDLERMINYAHRFWAKVYVTVNTLLYDSELDDARKMIESLYQAGADALIIQDVGLLEMDLPPIPLFASTQMHNHTPERVVFLEQAGFQRVILARELTLQQIRDIRQKTNLELETFIHGALCVSYSGQCAMSYALGGRSGNRGQCAQPCRRLYTLEDGTRKAVIQNRYLLSLRDLNISDHLESLIESGITSFKIEGRLKDKAYVMNIVSHYRRLLDEIFTLKDLRASSSGITEHDFTPNPNKTFNRGFTTYFLKDRGAPVSSIHTPKSIGERLGTVAEISKTSIRLDTAQNPLHPGDGICFIDRKGDLLGTIINQVNGNMIFPEKMDGFFTHVEIFRNHDHEFNRILLKSKTARKIRIDFMVEASNTSLEIFAVDEDGVCVSVKTNGTFEKAQNPDTAAKLMERQLKKLGETDFTCRTIKVPPDLPVYLTAAEINQLRRTAVEKLIEARASARPVLRRMIQPTSHTFPEKQLSFRGNVLNHLAEAFYRRHGVEEMEPAAETGIDLRGKPVMTTKYCLRYEFGACLKQPGARQLVEPLTLVDEQGNHFPLEFNCAECVMNIYFKSRS